jgi:hypothetical protein
LRKCPCGGAALITVTGVPKVTPSLIGTWLYTHPEGGDEAAQRKIEVTDSGYTTSYKGFGETEFTEDGGGDTFVLNGTMITYHQTNGDNDYKYATLAGDSNSFTRIVEEGQTERTYYRQQP